MLRVTFRVHCPFCDTSGPRTLTGVHGNNKISLEFDGDNNTLEWEVNCVDCDFPIRGATASSEILISPITNK
jgi:hypothetical protein